MPFWLLENSILDWSRIQHVREFNKVSTSSWDENEDGNSLKMNQNEFDGFGVTFVLEKFGGFRDLKMEFKRD